PQNPRGGRDSRPRPFARACRAGKPRHVVTSGTTASAKAFRDWCAVAAAPAAARDRKGVRNLLPGLRASVAMAAEAERTVPPTLEGVREEAEGCRRCDLYRN